MLRDVMRETREFPNVPTSVQEGGEQFAELSQRFQQAFLQGLQQAHKEITQDLRQTLLKIVRIRFPQMQRLARKQTREIDDALMLRDLIVKISIARSIDEAVNCLLDLDNEDDELGA